MQLKSIETTPNPNSMKLNLDEDIGAAVTYSTDNLEKSPEIVQKFLSLNGVKTVFVCHDFMTVNKDPRVDWKPILEAIAACFENDLSNGAHATGVLRDAAEKEGQVQILVQTFRGIPIQVKAVDTSGELRISLGERFNEAAQFVAVECQADFLKERYWADHGMRYGEATEVANDVAEFLRGKFAEDYLEQVKAQALGKAIVNSPTIELLRSWLADENWQRRLLAVEELANHPEGLPDLIAALADGHPQVRRLAAAALGGSGSSDAIRPLCDLLVNDTSPGVRRTAGDALSDLGDPSAQDAIVIALKDQNKLVRWRAARFLFDLGTIDAIPFLEGAMDDPQLEVRMEVNAAIERIKEGSTGLGPAWKRIVGEL